MKRLIPFLLIMLLIAACAETTSQPANPASDSPIPWDLTSPAFKPGEAIPSKYTCQGDDSSPALSWSEPPAGTKSLALIMDDPDAPLGTWVHWVVYNIPPDADSLAEGASKANASTFNLPEGTLQGRTSFNRSDYGGPCPPSGSHRYNFQLYALDTTIDQTGLDKAGLFKAMDGHILTSTVLMGTYQKQ